MDPRSAEIASEQKYFDIAAEQREHRLRDLAGIPGAAAHPGAAKRLKKYAADVAQAMGSADDAVAFGRIDLDDEDEDTLYIGKHLIRHDNGEFLVINWQAPAAARYFEASHREPLGVTRKRTFECDGNTIADYADVVFGAVAETVDSFLARVLARGRTGEMPDIVATIQAAQFDIIRSPMDRVLIIEGGPGTGKTAVALHRVSWLLFNHAAQLPSGSVLVVGPNSTFIRYIRGVLPSLGDTAVQMQEIGQLAPAVRRGRPETDAVCRLKGDVRMAGMLARSLESRIGEPEAVERLPLDGRSVSVPGADIRAILDECRAAPLPYSDRRSLFREHLDAAFQDRAGAALARSGPFGNLVERLWPQQTASAFLRELFRSRRRLLAAVDAGITGDEVAQLYRPGADRIEDEVWSLADLPLLDELTHLIVGTEVTYGHVVVDEAQDLSPMQLRSVARRSANGSFTIVGDLAQSTGLWARDDWQDVTDNLPSTHRSEITSLRYGYRVPREAYEYARPLLAAAAPEVRPPDVVRSGPDPTVHRVALEERPGRVVSVATGHAKAERFVGIVCPDRCRREIEAALAANAVNWSSAERGELGSAINLVSPTEAKGLEFDAVVVVEPERIVAENERGLRMLYVALTRTTGYLDVVCVGDPLPLTVPDDVLDELETVGHERFDDHDLHDLASHVAAQIRVAAPPEAWTPVIDAATRLLYGSEA